MEEAISPPVPEKTTFLF